MRLDIEAKHMSLAPHLMGWVAERLKDLNTPYDDIYEVCVTFVQEGWREAVCIDLLLVGKSLHVTQRGATPDAAAAAAFRVVQRELHNIRTARRARTSIGVVQEAWRAPGSITAGKAARSAPQA